jgi:hypothetical protein
MGDFLMLDDKGPLLFINTVKSDAVAKNQNTFDSRSSIKDNHIEFKEIRKLRNIATNKVIVGIPYKINDNIVLLKTQDGKEEQVDLTILHMVEIVRF